MRLWLVAGLALLSAPVLAADALNLDQVSGVYKDAFPNMVDGESRTSENILEVVKVSATEAYFRTRLVFYNGFLCSAWGVAKVEGANLVWRESNPDLNEKCVLKISFTGGKATFSDDDGGCKRINCGFNASFDGIDFDAKSRRPIRYMSRLMASRQYKEAMQERGK